MKLELLALLEETSERQRALRFQQRILDEVDPDADVELITGAETGIAVWRKVPLVLRVTFSYGLTKVFSVPQAPQEGSTWDSIETVKNAFKKYKPTTQAGVAKIMMTKLRAKYGKLLVAGGSLGEHSVSNGWIYANEADKRKDAGAGRINRPHGVSFHMLKHGSSFTYYVDDLACESLDDMIKCIDTALSLK